MMRNELDPLKTDWMGLDVIKKNSKLISDDNTVSYTHLTLPTKRIV